MNYTSIALNYSREENMKLPWVWTKHPISPYWCQVDEYPYMSGSSQASSLLYKPATSKLEPPEPLAFIPPPNSSDFQCTPFPSVAMLLVYTP